MPFDQSLRRGFALTTVGDGLAHGGTGWYATGTGSARSRLASGMGGQQFARAREQTPRSTRRIDAPGGNGLDCGLRLSESVKRWMCFCSTIDRIFTRCRIRVRQLTLPAPDRRTGRSSPQKFLPLTSWPGRRVCK